jgi:acyl dehydratase
MTTTVHGLDELKARLGEHLGYSDWLEIDQTRIDTFADATNDHQWIHTDPVRAATGPFGGTIAHGFLTLSLLIPLWDEILVMEGVTTKVNYGLNRVRFTGPVPAGSKIRAHATLTSVEDVKGGVQAVIDLTVERSGAEKPVCVAQAVHRYYA